jgi:hypothetical protein
MSGNGTTLLDITGKVLEADVKRRQFQLWTDEATHVSVNFRESEEADVTTALKDHKAVSVRVKGWGEVTANGKLLRITLIEELSLQTASEAPMDRAARPIEEIMAELAAEVPQTEWDKLPSDLTDNLDHYIYGTPKR